MNEERVDNNKIFDKLSKKYKIPLKDIKRIVRLGIASQRRAMAMGKRIQFYFGHFVYHNKPNHYLFLKIKQKNGKGNTDREGQVGEQHKTNNAEGVE